MIGSSGSADESTDGSAGLGVCTPEAAVVITGGILASEDLTIGGRLTGTTEPADHVLTIGPRASVQARVLAKIVTIRGRVRGTVTASDIVDIRDTGSPDRHVIAPHIALVDGAHLHGTVTGQSSHATPPLHVH